MPRKVTLVKVVCHGGLWMLVFVFSSYDLHTSFMFFMKYVTLAFNPIRGPFVNNVSMFLSIFEQLSTLFCSFTEGPNNPKVNILLTK